MSYVVAENLSKIFGGRNPVRALDGLSLSVEEGEVFGLLGPNGSGKTTFVKCCLRIIFPSSGRLRVLGRQPGHPRTTRQVGYLPENPNFYDHLSAYQFLYYHAELARIPVRERRRRVDEVLELVHLEPAAANRRLRTFSKGMTQRIGLAQAMIGRPKLIFLDEPQSGLDPIGRRLVKDIMIRAVKDGATVLFSSHVLQDVEDVADRVAIIDHGRLRKIAPLNDLILHTNKVVVRLKPRIQGSAAVENEKVEREKVFPIIREMGAGSFAYSGGMVSCTVGSEGEIPKLIAGLHANGFEIYEVTQERMSLEEVFLREFGESRMINADAG